MKFFDRNNAAPQKSVTHTRIDRFAMFYFFVNDCFKILIGMSHKSFCTMMVFSLPFKHTFSVHCESSCLFIILFKKPLIDF